MIEEQVLINSMCSTHSFKMRTCVSYMVSWTPYLSLGILQADHSLPDTCHRTISEQRQRLHQDSGQCAVVEPGWVCAGIPLLALARVSCEWVTTCTFKSQLPVPWLFLTEKKMI